ncbi:MAG: hypothetical protein FJ098_13030, partial [Deltaproteobacteria bacterium]|nr:hypothetical protein [Deltaproteobacteria bacterium]
LAGGGCTGEDRRCRIFCQGGCGKVEGCDCGDCPAGFTCSPESRCEELCLPDCAGRTCGDDGCGGSCGECGCGEECLAGACDFTACLYDECGSDGCGGSCGACEGPQDTCVSGLCECKPACKGRACGPDGCGGFCGTCGCGEDCEDGDCISHACDGRECGDDGCNGSCGACDAQEACDDGTCICLPACGGRNCGDDGCGGDCGTCACGWSCVGGLCEYLACEGRECGDDGCGKSCGTCDCGALCEEGLCVFHGCDGRECGGDGCGGSCGACGCGEVCDAAGQCVFTACDGKDCGADGCGGSCGSCVPGLTCTAHQCLCQDGNTVDWDGCSDNEVTEHQVNSFTAADQTHPAVAVLTGGGWVIAWQSCPSAYPSGAVAQDGDGCGVYAQRYASTGLPAGPELKIHEKITGDQEAPTLAGLSDGGFVVAWQGPGPDGSTDILQRRFNAQGQPLSMAAVVNTTTPGVQEAPAVAAFPGGGWVVAWEHEVADGDRDIRLQRFFEDGLPMNDELTVNTVTDLDQRAPALHVRQDHRYLVVWQSGGLACGDCYDGQFHGIAARRFKAGGSPDGDEFLVNTYTAQDQSGPAAGAAGEGDYVLWASGQAFPWELSPDGSGYGVRGQVFAEDGAALGAEHGVNLFTLEEQRDPAVAGRPQGDAIAAWESCSTSLPGGGPGQDGDGCAVVWRRMAPDGSEPGDEVLGSVYIAGPQRRPAVAVFEDGGFVLAWDSCPKGPAQWNESQDGSWCGV